MAVPADVMARSSEGDYRPSLLEHRLASLGDQPIFWIPPVKAWWEDSRWKAGFAGCIEHAVAGCDTWTVLAVHVPKTTNSVGRHEAPKPVCRL